MAKITGRESAGQLPPKVVKLYGAVMELIEEGVDISSMKVSQITERAGIGKGTAYDYFGTREEIIVHALMFFMEEAVRKLEQEIWEKENFSQRIELFMDSIDRQAEKGACLLCLVNLVFEASDLGQLFRKLLNEHREHRKEEACLLSALEREMVEKGIADGEIRKDLPTAYMTYILMAKIVAYALYTVHHQEADKKSARGEAVFLKTEIPREEFRRYILGGILEEFQAE